MAKYIIIDSDNRVVGYAGGSYTDENAPTGMIKCDSFASSDLFKIYDADNNTFTADDQTASLLAPPELATPDSEE